MKHAEFQIGLEFWSAGRRWRCTDVGSRVITAISLEPREVIEITSPNEASQSPGTRRYTTDDPAWLLGPPYKVVEDVFDEYDLESCYLTRDEKDADHGVSD
jgi:hypothetical protein